jgi:hypothetical protein
MPPETLAVACGKALATSMTDGIINSKIRRSAIERP